MKLALDVSSPDSEAVAEEDVVPDTAEVAADCNSMVAGPLLAADATDSGSLLAADVDSLLAADTGLLLAAEPDKGITPELLELPSDSMEVVPDSLPPGAFVCGLCSLVHEDREAWNRAHTRFNPCPSCGLVHADFSIDAMLVSINVYCELFMKRACFRKSSVRFM